MSHVYLCDEYKCSIFDFEVACVVLIVSILQFIIIET
jgi:hypothetical protein